MNSDTIRQKFLDFFKSKNHKIISSDSLVPSNDHSVLFTSAGMNQFKAQFMGNITDFKRAASSQKCLRTADLINVGTSPTHHTFFEMLGNFSFGDYFKKEAILWAWEFVTEILKLPPERLWISVHKQDEEAYLIWLRDMHIPKERIVKLGDADNFWPANAPKDGPNGPCGPCSEIFYDWGQEHGCQRPDCNPACDCKRFFEIWNLVFTQYDRRPNGELASLPSKNIDTGMGLERIVSVVQGVRSNYETDLFLPVVKSLFDLIKREGLSPDQVWANTKAKAIADHIRAATFAIADGVIPSNEARGYVIRKLIRRAIIYLKQAGIEKPLCFGLVYSIAQVMQNAYPEIKRRHETIAGIIKKEEEMFWTILKERAEENDLLFKEFAKSPANLSNTDRFGTASIAFNQYDTYGVPLEISKENAEKYGLEISDDEFERLMDEQRQRSRSKTQIASEIFAKSVSRHIKGLKSRFIGYEELTCKSEVLAIIKADALVDEADCNDQVDIVLDVTPFYAESGGQVGDLGWLINNTDHKIEVFSAMKIEEAILHKAKIVKGKVKKGDQFSAIVTERERLATARNHTATHLLQYALRKFAGDQIEQAGSYVASDKLRFDFSHLKPIEAEILQQIEKLVNECIWENLPVTTAQMNIDQARKSGALAFFGEKYADTVRVLSIGDRSKELCAGTHVNATGEIGLFKILSENSIAQGIRRIEAITGEAAFTYVQNNENALKELSDIFKVSREQLTATAKKTLAQIKVQEKELAKFKKGSLTTDAQIALKNAQLINKISVVINEFKNYDMDALRTLCDLIRQKKDPVICVLASTSNNKGLIVVALSASLAKTGLDAVKIIKKITALTGGGGGGKNTLAQAGVKDIKVLSLALKESTQIINNYVKNIKS